MHIICLYCVEILLDAAVIKEKMVEQRECFQNGFGWRTKKFPVPLLREGEIKQAVVVGNSILQVGFRGVEEKKSLDLLLGEKPVDLARVQNFCLRFPLPSIYRIQVILSFSVLLCIASLDHYVGVKCWWYTTNVYQLCINNSFEI